MNRIFELQEKENKGIIVRANNDSNQFATLEIDGVKKEVKVYELLVALKEIYCGYPNDII